MVTLAQIKEKGKCALEYNQGDREWLVGRPDGQILTFPAGEEGQRAAQLSALHHDCPDVATRIDALMQKYPDNLALHQRLIRAGFIVRDTPPELLRIHSYRVRSRQNPEQSYVAYLCHHTKSTSCQCLDWFYGNAVHHYTAWQFWADKGNAYAPFLPGFGIACKHVLAAWLFEQTADLYPCPECNGEGFFLVGKNPDTGWPGQCVLCSVCGSKGVIFDREIVAALTEPGPMPTEPMEVLPR